MSPIAPSSAPSPASLTPMMRQYLETKAQNPNAILMFRLGDFYEMFFEDAEEASRVLQLTLTSRSRADDHRIPMCGVPYHAARGYIARLVEAGYKVAICDQVEEPGKGKELVRREVTRVVTPGMLLDDEILDAKANNFLAALAFSNKGGGGLALLDASTGEFLAGEFPTDGLLFDEVLRSGAREVLVASNELHGLRGEALAKVVSSAALNPYADEAFDGGRAETLLNQHFGTHSLDGFGLGGLRHAVAAAGAAVRYLGETQKARAGHVDRIALLASGGRMAIDDSSCANLEILKSQRDGKRKGSLLGLVDKSATALGARRLARWLASPLLDLAEIRRRQDGVAALVDRGVLRETLTGDLRRIADLERLVGRLSLGQGSARDLRALADSLLTLPGLSEKLTGLDAPMLEALRPTFSEFGALAALLDRAIALEPPLALKEGGLIREGYDPELDRLVQLSATGKDFLLELEAREKEQTKIGSLKVRFNRVFGYYLEVTKANLHLVPPHYVRKQTTVGGERFITDELKKFEDQVLNAEERRSALEYRIFEGLREKVLDEGARLRACAQAIADLDALLSFAQIAADYGYVRPEVDDSDVIEIVDGRHPVVERVLGGEPFVPNDVKLDGTEQQILMITGPNMAGKSTIMRQVALITLLAQAGSFVPARTARIGLCDRIFTRVGASDNLARGQSTFMVEMSETANILHNATSRSLVILDEIGRGTSTFDGLSIAWAVAEHLHDQVKARTLFATHYHELIDLTRDKPRVKNVTIAVKEWGGKVVFLRKLIPGGASRSYGIEVAKLAGLPREVIERAQEILKNLESSELNEAGKAQLAHGKQNEVSRRQRTLFETPPGPNGTASGAPTVIEVPVNHPAIEALRGLEPERMTPLEALNALASLKGRL